MLFMASILHPPFSRTAFNWERGPCRYPPPTASIASCSLGFPMLSSRPLMYASSLLIAPDAPPDAPPEARFNAGAMSGGSHSRGYLYHVVERVYLGCI